LPHQLQGVTMLPHQPQDGVATLSHQLQDGMTTVWPTDTDLKLIPGTKRLRLTMQNSLIRALIRNTFENVQGSLLFLNAFPDIPLTLSFIRDALITAAAQYGPAAQSIHTRLLNDKEYVTLLTPLVSNPNLEDNTANII
jgi:hypothetical protein